VSKEVKPPVAPPPSAGASGLTRPFLVAVWTYIAGYLPKTAAHFGGYIPPYVMPALGLAAGAVGFRLARLEWSAREYDKRLPDMARLLAIVSGLAMSGWLYYAALADPLPAAGFLAVIATPLGAWYWSLHRTVAHEDAAAIAAGPSPMVVRPPNGWEQIFEAAGFHGVTVDATETLAGVTLIVRPAPDFPWTTSDIEQGASKISYQMAFMRPDIELRPDDLRVEPGETLPRTLVHVSWKRPLRAIILYEPREGPLSIAEPAPLGVDETGKTVRAALAAQNGQTVSATDGGKSVQTNGMIGRLGECDDVLIIAAGTEKLLPLVYPWLAPWLEGKAERPALDGVAGQRPQDVLAMLADLYLIVKMRNARNTRKSKHVPRHGSPAVIVIIEEATDLLRNKTRVQTFDGKWWTASTLLERICSSDRSASVAVYFLQQMALTDALGDHGHEIMRHISLRICGKTNSDYDGTATLPALRGTVHTTRLLDNTMLIQPSKDIPRVMPWKAYYLEDDGIIEPIALRNSKWRPELEPEIAEQCQWWPHRWDDGRLTDLVRECEGEGYAWPGTRGPQAELNADDERGATMETTTDAELAELASGVDNTVDAIETILASYHVLPEPFDRIDDVLSLPGAPTDWVSTAKLAVTLGRVAPDADEDELARAAWTLGREMAKIVPNLRSTGPRSVGDGRKRNGYTVERLKAACEALRRGIPLPPDMDTEDASGSLTEATRDA
jgi:hypothetical protein